MFAMNLALVANNIGLMWVAIELATLTTVLMVGIYRTHEALEAAWKYFILGSVGIALALFGTILVYMAARPVIGEGPDAMVWTVLIDARGRLRSGAAQRRLRVPAARLRHQGRAGAAACLAARCACRRPDADLGGAVGPAAERRALRAAALQDAAGAQPGRPRARPADDHDGPDLADLRGFMLYRRRDIKRMFAYSSIEHMGIIAFAFGMGGPLANFAGLLHMTMHSLTKSAIFFAVGHIAQVKGTQRIADMGGLTVTQSGARLGTGARRRRHRRAAAARHLHERVPGRQLDLRARAMACDPARVRHPARRSARCSCGSTAIAFGEPRGPTGRRRRPMCRCCPSGAGVRGRHLPAAAAGRLVPERRQAAGIERHGDSCADTIARGRRVDAHRPWPRVIVTPRTWHAIAVRAGRRTRDAARPVGRRRRRAYGAAGRAGRDIAVRHPRCPDGTFPSVGALHPPAIRLERAIRDLYGLSRAALPDTRPWLDLGFWDVQHPLGDTPRAPQTRARPIAFLPAEGEGLHQIPVGPVHAGIIEPGHFRFTANGETVVRLESGSAMCTRASSR